MTLHPFALESINISIEIRAVMLGEATIGDVVVALVKGVAIGILADGLCGTVLGMVLKPIMAVFGLGSQVAQIQGNRQPNSAFKKSFIPSILNSLAG